jgi:hypothetical protein
VDYCPGSYEGSCAAERDNRRGTASTWEQQQRMTLEDTIEKAMDMVQDGIAEVGSVWDFQETPHTRVAFALQ